MQFKRQLKIALILARESVRTLIDTTYDTRHYMKHAGIHESAFSGTGNMVSIQAQAIKDSHRIEKGLALRAPKRPFGDAVASRLTMAIRSGKLPEDTVEEAQSSLEALSEWNTEGRVSDLVAPYNESTPSSNDSSYAAVVNRRISTRDFDPTIPVELTLLQEAVELASHSPSVCNRRPWRVHVYSKPTQVSSVLAHQNGNRGFGDSVPCVLVVTTDSRKFFGSSERNQRWIDGGIFASTLVHSLESQGLSTCMLNWSRSELDSRALRRDAKLEPYENVVLFIAVGYANERIRRARSPIPPLDSFIELH